MPHLFYSSDKVYNLSKYDIRFSKITSLIRFIAANDTNGQTGA